MIEMNNPINILKSFMNGGGNPKNLVMKAIGGNNNPMIKNLIQMASSGNSKDIEQFARNYMSEKGIDFDTEFEKFMSNFRKW